MPGKVPPQPNSKKKGKSIKEKRQAKKQKSAAAHTIPGHTIPS